MQEAPRDGRGRSALYGRKQLKGTDANFVFYYVLQSVDPATAQMVAVVRPAAGCFRAHRDPCRNALHGPGGHCVLADSSNWLQGIDPRKTGHYSYHSVVPTQPRLANAHNKRTVTEHLERAYAAVHQADKALLARVLSPTPEQAHEISVLAADGDILGDDAQARFADVLHPGACSHLPWLASCSAALEGWRCQCGDDGVRVRGGEDARRACRQEPRGAGAPGKDGRGARPRARARAAAPLPARGQGGQGALRGRLLTCATAPALPARVPQRARARHAAETTAGAVCRSCSISA